MTRYKILIFIIFLTIFGWFSYLKTPIHVMAYKDHRFVSSQVQVFNGYTMTNLEPYEGEFRVFSTQKYQFTQGSEISPLDVLVGWGDMAKPEIYKQIKFSQSNRFGFWRYKGTPPLPLEEINRQAANMHLIAANRQIAKQLKKIHQDDVVYLKGNLVEITDNKGWVWRSSLSREDTGNGACELMLVTEIKILS